MLVIMRHAIGVDLRLFLASLPFVCIDDHARGLRIEFARLNFRANVVQFVRPPIGAILSRAGVFVREISVLTQPLIHRRASGPGFLGANTIEV